MRPLTIAYITSRKDPKLNWFLDSLANQVTKEDQIHVIVVSYHDLDVPESRPFGTIEVTKPKPCVWQGEHRLTKENWFAASNSRNTALCMVPDGSWLAYADDLSVLMPGWLERVRLSMQRQEITLGAYKKVKKLHVENGVAVSYEEFPGGIDTRWNNGSDTNLVNALGGWMFGCSLAGPVEAFLSVGGWPEFVDGLSSEDYVMGIAMMNAGWKFKYDRQMLTLESEELHHVEPCFKRSDYGVSPKDKSHAALDLVMGGMKYFQNYNEGGIPAMRKSILAGEPFPIVNNPQHEWYLGIPLKDL
jgi:hypothetical protein